MSRIISQFESLSQEDIVDKLREIKYIGAFPLSIEVLMVSVPIALNEANYYLRDKLSRSEFLGILKDKDIHMFNTAEDWLRYKNPELWSKQKRKRKYE